MSHDFNADDYRYDAPPRAFGSETEYTTNIDDDLTVGFAAQPYIAKAPFYLATGRDRHSSIVTQNGGEAYEDLHSIIEYATPESRTPEEVMLHERAGEQIMREIIKLIGKNAPEQLEPHLYKRTGYGEIYDAKGDKLLMQLSTGHHENYSSRTFASYVSLPYDVGTALPEKFHAISSYLATRGIWSGAGMVDTFSYSLTQKRAAINYSAYGEQTTDGEKTPVLFYPDRVELRSGDGNMSEWTIKMKYALSSLILRLIEHEKFPEELIIKYPTVAALAIATHPSIEVHMRSGEKMTALEHQSRIIDAAYEELSPANHIHPYEEKAVAEFDQFKRDFENISLEDSVVHALADRVDWATKLHYMYKKGMRHADIHGKNLYAVAADLQYERLDINSYARRLHKKLGQTVLDSSSLHDAMLSPPPTRAARRTRLIRHLAKHGSYGFTDWDMVYNKDNKSIYLGDAL